MAVVVLVTQNQCASDTTSTQKSLHSMASWVHRTYSAPNRLSASCWGDDVVGAQLGAKVR